MIPFKQTKHILTNEDWSPTYPDGTIEVIALELIPLSSTPKDAPLWKVLVRGADDFGLEKLYHTKEEALVMFDRIVHLTTIDALKNMGFVHQ